MAKASAKKRLSRTTANVVERFDASWSYAKQNHHHRWERNWKLYNNKRVDPSYQGTTNTFVPMSFTIVETMTSALAAGRPSIDFVPQDMYRYVMSYYTQGQKPDIKALNAQFDYYWDCDNWDLKTIKSARSGLRDGTCAEYIYWDGDKPRIINVPVRDLIIDPNIVDPMQLITNPNEHYAGRRYLTTKDVLAAEQVVDPATGELKPRFKKLDQVVPGRGPADQTDRELKEMFLGSTNSTDNLVEVIEIIDGERIRSVANRCVDIEDRPNDLGIIPVAVGRFIADENTIYGKSILDPIAAAQELLNDITNQGVDAVTDTLSPQYELDPKYSDYLPLIDNAPGTVYPFSPGSYKPIEKRVVDSNHFAERQNIKNEINEATGVDQIIKGVLDTENATATEIRAQVASAGQRFELYVRMLEKELLYQRSKIVYRMMLHYTKEKLLVPTNSIDGPRFRQFDPNQFDETYEPRIQLEATVKSAQAREGQQATTNYQIIIADPTNDLWQAKKILYPKMFDLTEEQLDLIIGQQPEDPAMADPGMAEDPMSAPGEEVMAMDSPVEEMLLEDEALV